MYDNDDAGQRSNLVQALKSVGLDAWEFNSGGGIMHVVVTLLDQSDGHPINHAQDAELHAFLDSSLKVWPHETCLYIATNSLRTKCDVGLMGNDGRTDSQVASASWSHADSIDEVISIFQQLWGERDTWLKKLIAGELAV